MVFLVELINIAYIGIFIALLDIVTIIHIILNKHEESVSAVLWLLTVIFIPVFGTALYILFGINRVYTKGLKIQSANKIIMQEKNSTLLNSSNKLNNASATMQKYLKQQHNFLYKSENFYNSLNKMLNNYQPESLILQGNNIDLLCDGTQAYPKMLQTIENAKSFIHLQSYIIMNDEFGKKLFALLKKKALEGVEVKVIYDRFGSFYAFFTLFFKQFVTNIQNFKIKSFSLKPPWALQLRNHRKLLIVDGTSAFIGGINISSENEKKNLGQKKHTHDLHSKITGPIVAELQFSFLRDWHCISKTKPEDLLIDKYFPTLKKEGEHIIRIMSSGPGQNYEATEKAFIASASTAKKSLWIMSPYFVPDKAYCKLLCATVARGIDVRIILPEKSDHFLTTQAARSIYRTLLEGGVRIFEKKGDFLHAKATLIDGKIARLGSSNCDVRSFRLNFELDIFVQQGNFPTVMLKQFKYELQNSHEILIKDVINKKIYKQLIENFCALFTPVL